MRLLGPLNSGVGAGGAGVATNNATSSTKLIGSVVGMYVRYNHSCPNTTDVVVKTVGSEPAFPSTTLLTLTNKNTDELFLPRSVPHDVDGAPLAALAIAEPLSIYDYVTVTMTGANNGDSVDVWFFLE